MKNEKGSKTRLAGPMKVTFVLPVKGGGGGAHSVAQEVNEMIRFGVDARIAVNEKNVSSFTTTYADLPNVRDAIDSFAGVAGLAELMEGRELVVCTMFTSVETVAQALERVRGTRPRVAYYVQDYEPLFCAPGDPLREQALASYERLPGALLFAKTDWIRHVVSGNHAVKVEKVSPSLDTSLYHPALRRVHGPVRVAAMVRPPTPRRAPRRTMSVLKEIAARHGDAVDISVFGCTEEELVEHQLPTDFEFVNHGRLMRSQVAALFRTTDLVMDLSDYQAFGRTGLEAMACGCATLLPVFGGTHEYAVDGVNAFLVDTRSKETIVARFDEYMALGAAARRELSERAVRTSQEYSIARAAWSELEVFERHLAAVPAAVA